MSAANSPVISGPSHLPSESIKRLLPWLVGVAFFMQSLDTTILNTAVPAIAKALGIAPLSMKAVLSSYTLSLAVFIPTRGWLAGQFGTRKIFSLAIGTFTLGSLLCGVSSNIHLLVACRILQGCGGAMMVPVGRLTLVRTFAKSDLVHPRVLSVRNLKQYPLAGRLSHPARLRRGDDGASGPAHSGTNICQVRSCSPSGPFCAESQAISTCWSLVASCKAAAGR